MYVNKKQGTSAHMSEDAGVSGGAAACAGATTARTVYEVDSDSDSDSDCDEEERVAEEKEEWLYGNNILWEEGVPYPAQPLVGGTRPATGGSRRTSIPVPPHVAMETETAHKVIRIKMHK
jgi:hypothetical protein